MRNEETEALWAQLPADAQQAVDGHVRGHERLKAVMVVKEAFQDAGKPVPTLSACHRLVLMRSEQLADRLEPLPPAPFVDEDGPGPVG